MQNLFSSHMVTLQLLDDQSWQAVLVIRGFDFLRKMGKKLEYQGKKQNYNKSMHKKTLKGKAVFAYFQTSISQDPRIAKEAYVFLWSHNTNTFVFISLCIFTAFKKAEKQEWNLFCKPTIRSNICCEGFPIQIGNCILPTKSNAAAL